MEFLRGAILGFSIAAPVGPIGVLCIRRTLAAGRWPGFLCGLGAASADAVYGLLAALGMSFVGGRWMHLAGGLFLCYLGVRLFLSRPAAGEVSGGFAATFALTLANPMTILSFAAMFAGLRTSSPALLVAGVFAGSCTWWLLLSTAASLLHLDAAKMRWVNRASGVLVAGFGLVALLGN